MRLNHVDRGFRSLVADKSREGRAGQAAEGDESDDDPTDEATMSSMQ